MEPHHVWSTTFYAGQGPVSTMQSSIVLVYYGPGGGEEAKAAAAKARAGKMYATTVDSDAFSGEIARANYVVILPSVPKAKADMIEGMYLGTVQYGRGSDQWNGEVTVFRGPMEPTTPGKKHTFDHTPKRVEPRDANKAKPTQTPTTMVERPQAVNVPDKPASTEIEVSRRRR